MMEETDDLDELSWAAELVKYQPQSLPVDHVKGLCQVDEDYVEVHLLLDAFFLYLSHSEDHISSAATRSETTLSLASTTLLIKRLRRTRQYLSSDRQQGDASVAATLSFATFVFEQGDNSDIPKLIGHTLSPRCWTRCYGRHLVSQDLLCCRVQ